MQNFTRITRNPEVMGGKPCISALRVTVGTIVDLMVSGHTPNDILAAYPYLEEADIYQALAWEEKAKRGSWEKFQQVLKKMPDVEPKDDDKL
ncbi:MAG: DUF433 domain-containing protein [Calothrix sp. MO_167.B12]|nr:DUF433 domain-containing protein [Calothrix sp. MO_167.B12]